MARELHARPRRETAADPTYAGPRNGGAAPGGGAGSALTWLLPLGVFAAIVISLWALGEDDSAGPEAGTTVSGIVEQPTDWYGQTVTVSGEVGELNPLGAAADAEVVGEGTAQNAETATSGVAFTIGGDSVGEQLLIVDADSPHEYLTEDSVVQVQGTVRRFDPASFSESFDVADADAWFTTDWFADWDGRPAVVAQSVDPTVPEEDVGLNGS